VIGDDRRFSPFLHPVVDWSGGEGTIARDVMLIDDVATALRITAKQIRRLERRGAFPIPRLPKLDRHPRYARALVQRFASGEIPTLMTRRRRFV
jgi:hypothetical protein